MPAVREVLKSVAEVVKADAERRIIEAYFSVFGNVDEQDSVVMPGAFTKTIAQSLPSRQIKLMRNHTPPNCGMVVEAREDSYGAWCACYVSRTQPGDEMLTQAADGSLTHFSFRAWVLDAKMVEMEIDGKTRNILALTELKLREVGPVDLAPANPLAAILAVKSAGGLPTGEMLNQVLAGGRGVGLSLTAAEVEQLHQMAAGSREFAAAAEEILKRAGDAPAETTAGDQEPAPAIGTFGPAALDALTNLGQSLKSLRAAMRGA